MSFPVKKLATTTILITLILAHSIAKGDQLLEGLKYSKEISPDKQIIHVLEVDPHQLNITAAHAKEKALGRETVAAIAKRYGAIAAINGGFFKIGESVNGLPAGILKIQKKWYGVAYRSRSAIGWSSEPNHTLIDRIQTKTNIFLNHHKFPLHMVNQPPSAKKIILYTNAYGKEIRSLSGGYDIIIQNNRILDIKTSGSTISIPENGYVYVIGPNAVIHSHPFNIGDPATVNIEIIPQILKEHTLAWQAVDNIIGGTPLMLHRNKMVHDYTMERIQSPFIMQRHARTAVGLLNNGHWVFVVVEQSAFMGSPGMTIPELTVFMQKIGCEYALNLDGGGSSTLYINNNVVNHPVGDVDEDYGLETLRPVSDAILILPKK